MAQSVEHVLGKDEVTSSSLVISSKKLRTIRCGVFCFYSRILLFIQFQLPSGYI